MVQESETVWLEYAKGAYAMQQSSNYEAARSWTNAMPNLRLSVNNSLARGVSLTGSLDLFSEAENNVHQLHGLLANMMAKDRTMISSFGDAVSKEW